MTRRAVLITGATGHLGRAVVNRFLKDGHSLHGTWIDRAEAEELERELGEAGSRIRLHEADVTDESSVSALFEATGAMDVLINLVGGFHAAPIVETGLDEWRRMLDMNATSAFLCSRAALKHMKQSGWGRIVNISAAPALELGAPGMAAYTASKAAVLSLTHSLSKEISGSGVTVNAVLPTVIDTPPNREAMPGADRSKWLQPSEIAEVVFWLASEGASVVTGTAVRLGR